MLLSLVRFQSDRYKVRGQGVVRHSRRVGKRFIVGLEFTEGLRWRASGGRRRGSRIPMCDPRAGLLMPPAGFAGNTLAEVTDFQAL